VIDWFTANYPDDSLHLLMGGDVFERITSWSDFDQLKTSVSGFIVGLRSEDDGEIAVEVAQDNQLRVQMVTTSQSGVSSSRLRGGEAALNSLTSTAVAAYIEEHQLY